jgi:cytochrome b pre-mRNA-processing protein 3
MSGPPGRGALALFATAGYCYLIAMLRGLFHRDPHRAEAERLYAALALQARQPEFFAELGIPDTVDGRFDLLSLHAALTIDRLAREEDGVALSQSLFDAMFRHLDLALREMGVQDLGVGRRIKIMAEGFHGRGLALRQAMQGDDDAALTAVLIRNVFGGTSPNPTAIARMVAYVRHVARLLADSQRPMLLAGKVQFPTV